MAPRPTTPRRSPRPPASVRRSDPTGGRRGVRRRRQGRDPRLDRVPQQGHRRRCLPRGISGSPRTISESARDMDCTIKLLAICEKLRRADGTAGGLRPRVPGAAAQQSPAGRGRRCVQRGRGGGRGRRTAHVLRPGPVAHRPPPPSSATWSRPPATGRGRPGPGRFHLRRTAGRVDGRDPHPLPRPDARGRQPGVLALVASEFSNHGVSIAQCRQTEVEIHRRGRRQSAQRRADRPHTPCLRAPSPTRWPRCPTRTPSPTSPASSVRRESTPNEHHPQPVHSRWPGLIEASRPSPDRENWEPVTLYEGGTPLIRATHLSAVTGARSPRRGPPTPPGRLRTAA